MEVNIENLRHLKSLLNEQKRLIKDYCIMDFNKILKIIELKKRCLVRVSWEEMICYIMAMILGEGGSQIVDEG